MVNKGANTMIFRPEEMIRIKDIRLLGYYNKDQTRNTAAELKQVL